MGDYMIIYNYGFRNGFLGVDSWGYVESFSTLEDAVQEAKENMSEHIRSYRIVQEIMPRRTMKTLARWWNGRH